MIIRKTKRNSVTDLSTTGGFQYAVLRPSELELPMTGLKESLRWHLAFQVVLIFKF